MVFDNLFCLGRACELAGQSNLTKRFELSLVGVEVHLSHVSLLLTSV